MGDAQRDDPLSAVGRRRTAGILVAASGAAISAGFVDLAGDYVGDGAEDVIPYLVGEPLYAALLALPFLVIGVVPLVAGVAAAAAPDHAGWAQPAVGVAVAAPPAVLTSFTGIAVIVAVDQHNEGSMVAWGAPSLVVGWVLMASAALVSWPRDPARESGSSPAAWIGSASVMTAFAGLQLLLWLPFSTGSILQVLWWLSAVVVTVICVVFLLRSFSRLPRDAASALMLGVGGYECLVAFALMSPAFFGIGIVWSLPLWVAGGLAVAAGWRARPSAHRAALAQDAV